jgi:CubicO group peptidase (beta-lactamase class C family)
MNSFEKKLQRAIIEETKGRLEDYTPSLDIEVYRRGKRVGHLHMGVKVKYYDLASLTKIIFAASVMMHLVDERKVNVGDSIHQYLPWWPHKKTTVADVLSHSAGLTWWKPFYKMVKGKSPKAARETLRRHLAKEKLASKKKSVYSDLDILLIGFLMEAVTGQPLLEIWHDLKKKLKLRSIDFSVGNKPLHPRQQYAPTENCPWRKKVLRGEVHDDNTWSFGGVSSHAGLFGRIEDVSKWGLLLRKAYYSKSGSALASHKTARLFTKRAIPPKVGDWALGFTMPSKTGSTSGKYFSPLSVGHTGFTGTSLWFDPKRDLLVVILTNRVYPTRENQNFRVLRPKLHDLIFELI